MYAYVMANGKWQIGTYAYNAYNIAREDWHCTVCPVKLRFPDALLGLGLVPQSHFLREAYGRKKA